MAAVALYDKYPDMCSDIVEKALRGVEYMIRYFYPNGAWYEGTGYWGYACLLYTSNPANAKHLSPC